MDEFIVQIPKQIENMQLPDPELLLYYQNLTERVIWVTDGINEYTLEVEKKIIEWNKEDRIKSIYERTPIKLFFFNFGGDLDVNNSLINIIELSKTPIHGVNMGRCCSAAAFIFLSCHKRYMLKDSYFLFHQGSGNFEGDFQHICAQIADYQEQVENLSIFMKAHTRYQDDTIEEKICGEWYVRSEEALENGVVDSVVDDITYLF